MKTLSILLSTLVSVLTCSCTFNRDWNEAVANYREGKYKTPGGPWTGTWTTRTNGHTGDLRAIVTPVPEEENQYDFRYHATWSRIFSGAFKVRYVAEPRNGGFVVNGEESLGLFGKFNHRAKIDDDSFEATYSNDKGELGQFSMTRPE
ncbi:MAG: hypothetical protein WD342_02250 [Verrucomicrobiales bacterium]